MNNPKINLDGTKQWFNSRGEWHNENGPALIETCGAKFWLINGKEHREDGPARINLGQVDYYINDKRIW